jgi:DNA ligase 1
MHLQRLPDEERRMTDLEPWAELCERLAGTTKKLEKRAWIADYLRELPVEAAAHAALYLAGTPFAEADGRQLSVGGASLWQVVRERTQASDTAMQAAYRRHGDLGSAAFDLLSAGRDLAPATLAIEDVAASFAGMAAVQGAAGSTERRQGLLRDLLARATPLEAKYLIKLMLGDMRIGVKQAQVEEAIAVATEHELTAVRRAVMLLGDLSEVVRLAEADRLDEARMRLFHPLGFMLASPVDSVEEAMTRFAEEVRAEQKGKGGAEPTPETEGTNEDAPNIPSLSSAGCSAQPAGAVDSSLSEAHIPPALTQADVPPALTLAHIQDKFDGIRCQLHCGDPTQPGRVALFSRSRDDMTHSYPELTEGFAKITEPLILDGEILAWNTDPAAAEQRALPFSSLQNRIGRKRVTAAMRRQTPVVFMAFDLLYRGSDGWGESLLLEQPLAVRRELLEQVCAAQAPHTVVSNTPGEVESPHAQGALFAEPDAAFEPGESFFARLVLAPIARLSSAEQLEQAYVDARARGNEGVMLKAAASLYQPGRRGLAWLKLKRELATLDVVVTSAEYGHGKRAGTLSDYTFAVRDGDTLKNVGKAYSGLTDAEIAHLSQYFHEHTIEDFGGWRTVEPTVILEVAFNNLMRSDRHASGFAMRFPRILRIRDDKPVEEIDTLARVEEIYNQQPDKPVDTAQPDKPTDGQGINSA